MDRSRCRPVGRLFIFCALLAFAAPGCGGGSGDVQGTVTYNGKPVTSGSVGFAAPDGKAVYATINADGTYTAAGVPAGLVKVSVSSPDPSTIPPPEQAGGRGPVAPPKAAPKAAPPKGWVAIPAKYGNPDGSGLSVEVKSGSTPFDIKLTD